MTKLFTRHAGIATVCAVGAILSAALATGALAYVGPTGVTGLADDLPPTARQHVMDSVNSLRRPRAPAPDRPANSLAEECLAAAEVYAHGDHSVEKTMRGAADDLLASAIDGGRKPAWGRRVEDNKAFNCPNGGAKDNGNVCDPPDTPYIFQSGEAGACIARVAKLTGDAKYAEFIKRANEFWERNSGHPKECGGCRYFWSSDIEANNVRYVRNLNLYGALPIAIWQGRPGYTPPVVAEVLKAEAWEASMHNNGYLSALDPGWGGKNQAWESDRIENHAVAVATILMSIYNVTGNEQARKFALEDYTLWATCNNSRCQHLDCRNWSANPQQCVNTYTYAHCAFRNDSALARQRCLEVMEKTDRMNANELLFVLMGDKPAK